MVTTKLRRNGSLGTFIDRVRSYLGRDNAKSYNDLLNENRDLKIALRLEREVAKNRMASNAPMSVSAIGVSANWSQGSAIIAAQETPGANATARKMAALARGDM